MPHIFDRPWLLALVALTPIACSADSSYGFDSDGGYSSSGAGAATTGGATPDPTTGVVEDEVDFQVPRASG